MSTTTYLLLCQCVYIYYAFTVVGLLPKDYKTYSRAIVFVTFLISPITLVWFYLFRKKEESNVIRINWK